MARPPKKGLVYFPRDTDYYDDFKIIDLMYEHGTLGQTVYDVILTVIYRNGYYVELSLEKMVQLVIRVIGNRWASKEDVTDAILYCAEIGLFDRDLLMRNVFTSAGIQKRYDEITARSKVDKSKYWLLEDDNDAETEVFAEETNVSATKTSVFAEKTPISDARMQQIKVNKSKEKKIKENCDDDNARARVNDEEDKLSIVDKKYGVVMLTERQMIDLLDRLTLDEYNYYVEKLGAFIVENDAHVKSHYETILKWVSEDRSNTGVCKQNDL